MTSTPSSKRFTDIGPIRTLLATAVDHAGLFPPTGLNMSAAVAAFDSYRKGPHAWMLGAFVVPAGRIEELARALEAIGGVDGPWPLSIIVDTPEQGARSVDSVRGRGELFCAAAIEVRPQSAAAIRDGQAAVESALEGVAVFHEVPLDDAVAARLDAIGHVGAHAKVRTGGLTEAAFPSARALVHFLCACAERGLALKATAGLHHAFRGTYPLTYEPASACAPMHGFVGVALVAALIHAHAVDSAEAAELLGLGLDALSVEDHGVHWGGHALTVGQITAARASFFHSFGSCSFAEPVAELEAAGLI